MTRARALALGLLAFQLGRAIERDGLRFCVHNLAGHAGLVLAPAIGERIHEATIPEDA